MDFGKWDNKTYPHSSVMHFNMSSGITPWSRRISIKGLEYTTMIINLKCDADHIHFSLRVRDEEKQKW